MPARPSPTPTTSEKPLIFISCGQFTDDEKALGKAIERVKGNGIVHVVQWASLESEADGIAEYISKRIEEDGVQAGEVLILAPRRKIGDAVRDTIVAKGVLAHSFFNEQALDGNPMDLDRCQAQQAFALLTLLAEAEDRVALRCWCGFGSGNLNENGSRWVEGSCRC